jgi:uncharacterized membrane protein HdeD (DUF308 family)
MWSIHPAFKILFQGKKNDRKNFFSLFYRKVQKVDFLKKKLKEMKIHSFFITFDKKTMELKSYEKPWLLAFKGAFLIIFGIIALLKVVGSIRSLSMLFILLTSAIALLLIASAVISKKSNFKNWYIFSGVINLSFSVSLFLKFYAERNDILWIMFVWVIFYSLTELIEAGILIRMKNAFYALFLLNAILTLLFGYFLYVLLVNFTPQGVFYIGLIALTFGIANVLSSYLLNRIK